MRRRIAEHEEAARLGGGVARVETQHKKGKLTARERLTLLLDEGTFRECARSVRPNRSLPTSARSLLAEGDCVRWLCRCAAGFCVQVRHAQDSPMRRLWHGRAAARGRRRGHWPRQDRRAHRLRLLTGLHSLRRLARRGPRGEDLQGDGQGDGSRRARDRPQRLRWRPHPRGRRLARGIRGGLPAERRRQRSDSSDLGDHGAMRGWRRLLTGDDRLHDDGGALVRTCPPHACTPVTTPAQRRRASCNAVQRRSTPFNAARRRPLPLPPTAPRRRCCDASVPRHHYSSKMCARVPPPSRVPAGATCS